MIKEPHKRKLNNQGFSLLEVLVAIVILAIVSIPFLHSFITSAKTNSQANTLLHATAVAENVMEDMKYYSVDEIVEKYQTSAKNTVTTDADGKYEFIIKNPGDYAQSLPDGYYVNMTLDPTLYSNANALNLSDFSTVSASDSAVYTMAKAYDDGVYDEFVNRNTEACNTDPSNYFPKDKDYFKENLKRTITVSIIKKGTAADDLGDLVELVTVNVKIVYELKDYASILPAGERKYEVTDAQMFDNTVTKTKLASIFLLYNPRYLSAVNKKGDVIVVENIDNIKTNLYIVAQEGAEDDAYQSQYLSKTNGLLLTVIENPASTGFPADTNGAVTLRTNLNSGAPYSGKTGETAEVLCSLTYQNLSGSLKTTDTAAQKILHAGDETGKALDSANMTTRIYKVTTTVFDGNGKKVVSLDGTKLND